MDRFHNPYANDLQSHARLLKDFFSALFGPNDTVYIYPRLRPGSPLTIRSGLIADELPTEGRVVSRKPSSTNTKTLARLHELNAQGYDIYFCVNPLIHPRRCQKGVVLARNILIEMDHSEMETQREMLERFKSNIVSAACSGRRSLHMIVKMNPPLWNPNLVGRMMVSKLKKGETSARWPQYVDLANRWIARLEMLGHAIDNRVAKDYSRLSRVPGFLHAGAGMVSILEHLDAGASWDWKAEVEEDAEAEEPTEEEMEAYFETREAEVPESVKDRIWGRDVLFPDVSISQESTVKCESISQKQNSICLFRKKAESFEESINLKESNLNIRDLINTSTTNVVRNQFQKSFLDEIEEYERLKQTGLPGRGTRMIFHKVVFTAARVFGWDEEQLKEEWRGVIEANLKATDKRVDEAVESIMGDWHANKKFKIYIPNLARLPEMIPSRATMLEKRLGHMGCREPKKGGRIIQRVLLPTIQSLPGQCGQGKVGIQSTRLQSAVHARGESRGYRSTWEWMQESKIVECTDLKYQRGRQTRTYWINIPLVLWLCGYRTDELDWSVVPSNFWPELSRMRVVNDNIGGKRVCGS